MGYMLLGTFLVAGSMGALEVDQIGWEQFIAIVNRTFHIPIRLLQR